MVITSLLENTTTHKELESKHGLCLHIKTENNNILFDLGPDDTFIKNANKLNIDIGEVDTVIISHGHKDHGGGLLDFINYNQKAKIYINKNAFDSFHYSLLKYFKPFIGLDNKIINNKRIILVDNIFNINDNLILFSKINNKNLTPSLNRFLLKKNYNGDFILDDFNHEQNLIIKEGDEYILFAGCAHNGITNILNKAEEIINSDIYTVISGLHLFDSKLKKSEKNNVIEKIANKLLLKNTTFYTCHCTGIKPFKILKNTMGDKIKYLSTGETIEINTFELSLV